MSAQNKQIGLAVVFVMAGTIVMYMNNSIINILIPELTKTLNISLNIAQWLSNGFVMICGILFPVSAYLVRRFTYKSIFVTAQVIFLIGSLICTFSTTFPILMFGRIIQSIATGLATPLALNIVTLIFPAEKRGAVMGVYSLCLILGPAIGPSVGGFVIQYYSYNVLFGAMAVLEFIILIGTLFFLKLKNKTENAKFDAIGFVLSGAGCGALLYSISQLDLIIAVAAVLLLAVFVVYSLKRGEAALLDMTVFKDYNFTYSLIINIIFTMAMYSGMLLLPQYLQVVRGISPLVSALLILPGSIFMGILGIFTGRIFDRHGIKALAIVGSFVMTAVTYSFSRLTMDTPYYMIVAIYLLRALGIATAISPLAAAGLTTLTSEKIPHGNALTNTIKQIAGSVGSCAAVAIMTVSKNLYFSATPAVTAAEAELHGINFSFLNVTVLGFAAIILAACYRTSKNRRNSPAEISN
jgi:EmrB/QacA subfamily drug resistance transporter